MRCELELNLPAQIDLDDFKVQFEALSSTLNVDYILRRIR